MRSQLKSPSLDDYFHRVQHYPLLGSEEAALTEQYARTRSPELRRQLVTANLRLVLTIVADFARRPPLLNDLVQEGNLGLLHAVERFDPHRGVSLATYARWRIRDRILKFLLDNHRLVKVARTQAQRKLFYNLRHAERSLQCDGEPPTAMEIAEYLDVSERDVKNMQVRLSGQDVSLDAGSSESSHPANELPCPGELPDVAVERRQVRERLQKNLQALQPQLTEQENEILHDRLLAEEPTTLEALGARRNVSRQNVRQTQQRLLQRLKDYVDGELHGEPK